MEKLKNKFKAYLQNSSKWKIGSDVFFYLFIILMIIPATRKPLSTALIKATMRKPNVKTEASVPRLAEADYQMAFMDMEGNNVSISDLKGEVILLNFWATWCPPCRAEMPSLQKLYDSHGDRIVMLLVTSDKLDVINQYLSDYNYNLPVYIQRTEATPNFQVRSIPTTFLIAKDGQIVSTKTGAANWNSDAFKKELDKLLAE
ncbi:MAG: TlpA family protein disulfide reductase [Bacteroidales bacterium]|nr:TlpA family protein disulfide reductase [Bacteroidales bacterium]